MNQAPTLMLDAADMGRLRWRCRRGLLENDLFIERFFVRHQAGLAADQARGLGQLMELPDNDLLDLLLGRSQPSGDCDTREARDVLALLRQRTNKETVQ